MKAKAFPSKNKEYDYDDYGMDLRDYFAGQVIIGFLANPSTNYSSRLIVPLAYEMADAMMEARK
jgi:hypothetical protein